MQAITRIMCLAGALLLAACATTPVPPGAPSEGWTLQETNVTFGPQISREATGAEFSSSFVWNTSGDGDKRREVITLFESAMRELANENMRGTRAVNMDVQVNYFHALTRLSRLVCCGEHRIFADLSVTDAETGEVLKQGDNVYLGRLALGGIPALVAVAAGRDQSVRIKEGIVNGTAAWLGTD